MKRRETLCDEIHNLYRIFNELPATKMSRSGDRDIMEFGRWWPTVAKNEKGILFPKDFWWNNEQTGRPEWLYAIPEDLADTNGYEVFDFPGACTRLPRPMMKRRKKQGQPARSSSGLTARPEFTIFLPIVKKA